MAAMPDTSRNPNTPATAPCELTVLMPCLDEAETIGVCVKKAMGYIESRKIDGEVLIADNGSTDGSQAIAERLGTRASWWSPRRVTATRSGAASRRHWAAT